jgi:hypothetical protein
MKKIFTLSTLMLMAVVVFAADHRPVVWLDNSRGNYKVVIDGKSYFGDRARVILDNFTNGYGYGSYEMMKRVHSIKVYEIRRGFFSRERLVDATTFAVGREDLMIRIDRFGRIKIRTMRDRDFRDYQNRDFNDWNSRDLGKGGELQGWDREPGLKDEDPGGIRDDRKRDF